MAINDDPALAWANGFCHGMEYLALAFQARVDGGQEPAGAILGGQVECLVFIEELMTNGQDRDRVIDLLRSGGLNYGQNASD